MIRVRTEPTQSESWHILAGAVAGIIFALAIIYFATGDLPFPSMLVGVGL